MGRALAYTQRLFLSRLLTGQGPENLAPCASKCRLFMRVRTQSLLAGRRATLVSDSL